MVFAFGFGWVGCGVLVWVLGLLAVWFGLCCLVCGLFSFACCLCDCSYCCPRWVLVWFVWLFCLSFWLPGFVICWCLQGFGVLWFCCEFVGLGLLIWFILVVLWIGRRVWLLALDSIVFVCLMALLFCG